MISDKKILINLILIFLLMILIIINVLLFIRVKDEDKMFEDSIKFEEVSEEDINNINKNNVTINELINVKNCIEKFLASTNINNSTYYAKGENDEYVRALDDNSIYTIVKDFLSTEYIEKNDITDNNISNYIDLINEEQEYTVLDIEKLNTNNPIQFAVYGIISQNNEFYDDRYYIVTIDYANTTFAIEPITDINNITEIQQEDNNSSIESNPSNKIIGITIEEEEISKYYFSAMKNILRYNKNNVMDFLDEEYVLNRFKTSDNFYRYIDKNYDELTNLRLTQYKVETIDENTGNTRYLLVDQYKNIYTIEAETVTNFTIKLDTYTIISDKFKETYDSSNEQQKVAMNIDKWIQMLNTRDYINAYNVLDETFRNNNWGSEEKFEQYMREKLPLHYDVEYTTYSNEGSTYVQSINLTDITSETDGEISLNIIMQLKDNYEFVMSFSIEE